MPNYEHGVATLNMIFDKINLNPEIREKLLNKLKSYEEHVLNHVLSIINANGDAIDRFSEVIHNCGDGDYYFNIAEKAFMILHPTDHTMIRVYPNIIIDKGVSFKDLKGLSIFDDPTKKFSKFMENYNNDMLVEHRKIAWATKERIVAKLNKYIDLATSTAMARYVKWPDEAKEDMVRDFADNITDHRKPLELSFAVTPEDYTIMYGNGPHSCMINTGPNKEKWKELTNAGLCPASFYAYFPYTKGCYVVKRNKVVARSILYCYPSDMNTWYYGNIYAATPVIREKFINSMEQAGISNLLKTADYTTNRIYVPPKNLKFKIPGIPKYNNNKVITDYVMPWPYFDNMEYYGKGFYASFDDDTKEFTIIYSHNNCDNSQMLPVRVQSGMVYASSYKTRICDLCKEKIDPHKNTIQSHDGDKIFCSEKHARQSGLLPHYTVQGNIAWLYPTKSSVSIFNNPHRMFTTLDAAMRSGYCIHISDYSYIPEEGDMKVELRSYTEHFRNNADGLIYGMDKDNFMVIAPCIDINTFKKVTWDRDELNYIMEEKDDDMEVPILSDNPIEINMQEIPF